MYLHALPIESWALKRRRLIVLWSQVKTLFKVALFFFITFYLTQIKYNQVFSMDFPQG